MQDFAGDLFRGTVTSFMNAVFLFVLAKPKYSNVVTALVIAFVSLIDIIASIYFYLHKDLTSLAKFDLFLLLGIMIFLKFFVKDKIFPWIFNCITAVNILFIIMFLSYHLCDFFPYPYYSNSILRGVFYIIIIWLFLKYVSPLYQQVLDNWQVYVLITISINFNLMYYIVSSEDIEETLNENFTPLLLLIFMSILVYITILYFQQKSIANYLLIKEKQHYKDLAFIDKLTGVQNRNGYENYISNVLRINPDNICIGIFDLNDLKAANDSFGHEAGDKLLCEASRIICHAFGNSSIFRIGGDEFLSVSMNVSKEEIEKEHDEMRKLLAEYNNTALYPINLNIAFGYSIQTAPFSIDKLFTEADNNMYKNKVSIKNDFF